MPQKIRTFLWFDSEAEEASNFYVSIFKNSDVLEVTRYGPVGPGAEGSVMTTLFRLDGQEFIGLNGGPLYTFSEAISLSIDCDSQEEVDYFWDRLTEGGEPGPCGWLKDKFGLSWQVVPSMLPELLTAPDPEGAQRAMRAMLQMSKIDIATLQRAYDGE